MYYEEALKDFLRALKLSIKNASIYPENHPTFIKSVTDVRNKIDSLLKVSSPLKIGFSPHSLLVEGRFFENEILYEEMAREFHFRGIKTIEIREGITLEELSAFLTKVYLSPRDILKEGGFQHILAEEKISHLAVEKLDYFELLKGEGEELKEIWPYLLQEAVEQKDAQKITELADNFERVVGHIKTEDIFEKEETHENIDRFLTILKDVEKKKLRKCSKELLKAIIKNAEVLRETKVEGREKLFKDLRADDVASTLLEEILTDDNFNTLSFQVFSKLAGKGKEKKVAGSFAKQFREQSLLSHTPKVRNKIKDLLTGSTSDVISEIYRQTLSSLLRDFSSAEELTLDQNLLRRQYRYILLNILDDEKRKKRLITILEIIKAEWENIVKDGDFAYLKYLLEVLNRRSELAGESLSSEISQNILNLVVDKAVSGGRPQDFDDFKSFLSESFIGVKAYLDKIFKESMCDSQILKTFFQLYPDSLHLFQKNLLAKSSDSEFLHKITESLENVDSSLSLESVKFIFYFSAGPIKVRALKAMQSFSAYDEELLLKILGKGDYDLRREALTILMREKSSKDKAIEVLFSVSSPLGIKNRILIENARIIQELEFKEAKDGLKALSQKKYIWNKKLRQEALKILEKWNA